MGGDSSNYDRHSGRILDFKQGQVGAINEFDAMVEPLLGSGFAIAVVPSHDPDKQEGPLDILARKLASRKDRVDASKCLQRHTKVAKLATGGPRGKEVHLKSIRVHGADLVRGKSVLLLDDVTTTGGSFDACTELLLRAGAKEVKCLALGKTG
jgi:predicted amidophosphoribosyltransferase